MRHCPGGSQRLGAPWGEAGGTRRGVGGGCVHTSLRCRNTSPCIPSHAWSPGLVCAPDPKDRELFHCQSSYFYCSWLEIYELSHVVFISRS